MNLAEEASLTWDLRTKMSSARVSVRVGPSPNLLPSDSEQPGSKPSRRRMGPRHEVIAHFIAVGLFNTGCVL